MSFRLSLSLFWLCNLNPIETEEEEKGSNRHLHISRLLEDAQTKPKSLW